MEKWKKSVVNIGIFDYQDKYQRGSAVFVKDKNQFYLVTARHLIADKEGNIYPILKIVNRYGYYDDSKDSEIRELQAAFKNGKSHFYPYNLTNNEIDITIISLNSPVTEEFKKSLLRKGYLALDMGEIYEDELTEGKDIFTLGFPDFSMVSMLPGYNGLGEMSLPIFSFGKVATNHSDFPFFIGDISNYGGSSGGPVISDDKLVGIVISQFCDTKEIDKNKSDKKDIINVRQPLTIIVKSKVLIQEIKCLQKREW